MRNSDPNPFLDRKTLIAIVIIGVFMMGWQHLMNQWYPPAIPDSATPAPTQPVRPETEEAVATPGMKESAPQKTAEIVPAEVLPESFLSFEDERLRFTISSKGMGFKEYIVKDYLDAEGKPVRLGFSPLASLYEMKIVGSSAPLDFRIEKVSATEFQGVAEVQGTRILRTLTYHPEDFALRSEIRIEGELASGFTISLPEMIHSSANSSWLFPSYDYQDFFVQSGAGKAETINFNHASEDVRQEIRTASLVSVGNQYFTLAALDRSSVAPDVKVEADLKARTALAELVYQLPRGQNTSEFQQTFYAGPKSIDVLKKIDPAMAEIIDFGYMTFLAKPLLYVMKWFHSLVGNWGVAIILLTIMVRFVVLPFNLMSARSMKAMQKIQPYMKDLREKYKDDPMTMNREMMGLMKEHKANPLGGCLPVLLQIPIFFALFRVIGSTVELYQSPFAWWIQDLSAYDKYYVLPVILGLTMYLQQKMTPTTMDPAQARIMAFLPLVFTVFMLQLPSGLTLYMVVSAVFGIIQQWYILREPSAPVPAAKK